MDNNLTTLGKRENAVFILTPLYLALFYFFREFCLMDDGGMGLLSRVIYIIGLLIGVVCLFRFFRRIVLPSKILECDEKYLYISKGLKETKMIPWTDVRSVDNLHQYGDLDAIRYGLQSFRRSKDYWEMWHALWDLSETGIIVINCKDELVRVHGVKNAREVRNELHKIISSKRKKSENSFRL